MPSAGQDREEWEEDGDTRGCEGGRRLENESRVGERSAQGHLGLNNAGETVILSNDGMSLMTICIDFEVIEAAILCI